MSRARSRRAIAGACAVAMLGITACSTDTVTPVSYTHLDVYKRQVPTGLHLMKGIV